MVNLHQNITRRSPLMNVNSVRETPKKSNLYKPGKTPRENSNLKPKLLFKAEVVKSKDSLSGSLHEVSLNEKGLSNAKTQSLSKRSFDSQQKLENSDEYKKKSFIPISNDDIAHPVDETDDQRQIGGLSETDQVNVENIKKKKWSTKFKQTVKKILPSRKNEDEVKQSIHMGSDDEYYEAPTDFHAMCFTASSVQEICDCYNLTSKIDREQLDYLGRSPVDLIFQNHTLAKAMQCTETTFDDEKIRNIAIFVSNILLHSMDGGQLQLKWHVFTSWINTIDFGWRGRENEKTWLSVISTIHKQAKHQRRDSNSDDVENPNAEEQNHSTNYEECDDVALPMQVYFALRLLSIMIDELNETSHQSKHKRKTKSPRSRMSIDSVATFDSSKKSSFNLKRKKLKRNITPPDSDTSFLHDIDASTDSIRDVIEMLVESFAGIKHLMKSFIMIDNESDCKRIFEEDIVRRAMLRTQSIEGSWLSDMLQHDHRKRATGYLLLLSELSTKKARNAEKRSDETAKQHLNDLLTRIGQLDGLIPSMLAVEEKDIEDLATTPMITKVLDEMISTPFACTLFFFDFLLLGLLIFFFRLCVDAYLQQQETHIVLRWLYATLFSAFHFQMRAIGRVVSLISMTRNTIFRNAILFNFWNILQTGCLFMVIWCIITIRFTAPLGTSEYILDDRIRWQFAITTLMLWFNLLGLVKSINMKLATFVCAISQIIKDVYWYVVLIVGMILCFSQVFYTILIPSNCLDVMGARACRPREFYLLVYSVLLGELDDQMVDSIGDKVFALLMFFVITFIMAIVLLNILIAVISDSYEKTLIKSTRLFGRARVHQLAEILALQDLFRVRDTNKISNRFVESRYFMWTKGGLAFFLITFFMYVFWAVVDLTALSLKERQHGFWNLSFLVFVLNLVMFGIFLLLLASCAQTVDSKVDVNNWLMNSLYRKIQWIIVRLLGQNRSHNSLIHDDWAGRLMFIKREIASSNKKIDEKLKNVQEDLKRSKKQSLDLRNGMDTKLGLIQRQIERLIDINKDAQSVAMGRSTI